MARVYRKRKVRHMPTYRTWASMLWRANKSELVAYRHVTIDPRWEDFNVFIEDMGPRPDGMTLDRIDNTKGYCKDNCRWASSRQQGNNRRSVIQITDSEETLSLKVMCEKHNLPYSSIFYRLKVGWTVSEAFGTPVTPGAGRSIQRVKDDKFNLVQTFPSRG